MKNIFISSIVRHILTVVATLLAAKGFDIGAETIDSVTNLVLGLLVGGGVMINSYVEKKTKPVDVVANPFSLKDNPIVDVESTKEAPKGFFLSERSEKALKGVDADLVKLIRIAIVDSPYDFVVTEGLRSAERQEEMRRTKKSRVKRSKHQDGLAVDIMCYDENGNGTWEHKYYNAVAAHIKKIAEVNEIAEIEWGGDWQRFVDAVHFQINK
jgi:peptidoglycan L-alanyl-D-glutamate endopeptidase CwlK